MWPFRKKPKPLRDDRIWNDDWRVGDIAECIQDAFFHKWSFNPKVGDHLTVAAIDETSNERAMFFGLGFDGKPPASRWATTAFRKVRTVSAEQSEVVSRILNAKPGADNPREDAILTQDGEG